MIYDDDDDNIHKVYYIATSILIMEYNTNITQFLQTKSKMIVIIASAMVILGIFSTNEANAIFFDQNLRIHVDKGPYSLGDYGVYHY